MCKLVLQSNADKDRHSPIKTYQTRNLKRIKLLYQQNVEKSLFKTDLDSNNEYEEDNVAEFIDLSRAEHSSSGIVGICRLEKPAC